MCQILCSTVFGQVTLLWDGPSKTLNCIAYISHGILFLVKHSLILKVLFILINSCLWVMVATFWWLSVVLLLFFVFVYVILLCTGLFKL